MRTMLPYTTASWQKSSRSWSEATKVRNLDFQGTRDWVHLTKKHRLPAKLRWPEVKTSRRLNGASGDSKTSSSTCYISPASAERHELNERFRAAIQLVRDKHKFEIIMEEWWQKPLVSFASTLESPSLKWGNVGTPDETQFETWSWGLNCDPPTYDPSKPRIPEYGPLEAQERGVNPSVETVWNWHTCSLMVFPSQTSSSLSG
jgi:hypothetical protein